MDILNLTTKDKAEKLKLYEQCVRRLDEKGKGKRNASASLCVYAVGRALAWLHAQGLCHTDLKPSDVIRCTRAWKLCDFAAAGKPCASCQNTEQHLEQHHHYKSGRGGGGGVGQFD